MLKKDHLDNQDRLFLCPVPGPNLIEVLKWLWIASFPDIEMTLLDFCIFWAAYTMDTPSVTTPFNTLCLVWSTNSADWPLSNPIWAKATIHWQLTKVLQRSQTMTSLGATRICSSLKAVFHKVAIRAACSRLTAWRFVGCNVLDSCHYLVEGSSSCYVSSLILKTLQDFSSSVTVVLLTVPDIRIPSSLFTPPSPQPFPSIRNWVNSKFVAAFTGRMIRTVRGPWYCSACWLVVSLWENNGKHKWVPDL